MRVGAEWKPRTSYMNVDQQRFRTIGETIGDGKQGQGVVDADVSCLAADLLTVRTGEDNCFPFWVDGAQVDIGKDLTGATIKQDQFVWLTQEGISCGTDDNGVALTNFKVCKMDDANYLACNSGKIANLGLTPGSNNSSICVGTVAWKKR